MKPIVIVDANALHGLKAFSKPDVKTVLTLAKTNLARVIVPEVVVHELSRQGAKEFNDRYSSLRNAVKGFNDTIGDVQTIGLPVAPTEAKGDGPSPMNRAAFFDAMIAFLHNHNVETPSYPDLAVADLLARDLDYRKPFTDGGKGFRDALIWETIRKLCNALTSPDTPVVFATKNYTDFCTGKGKSLHSQLRGEIDQNQPFDVVEDLAGLLAHIEIKPLADSLRVFDQTFTAKRLEGLVDDALAALDGQELERTIGVYEGDGYTAIPVDTALSDTAFDGIVPENDTITHEVFRTGDEDEMTIRVTVDAECSIEGFIDKTDYYAHGTDSYSYSEDWNFHVMRASETCRMRFILSGDFTDATIDTVKLTVDEAEELVS
ncbi:PIN domain-containing protein [Arthrobacter crystallopoietes]|uniref:PIN domain-containing protein n=1 Tax=Crystallibacter crystallopoietes TaxID=37928 RepID=UPI003D22D4CB